MNKANSIEKLIRAGATVADVVKKLKVSKSYVYVVIHARMGKTENLKPERVGFYEKGAAKFEKIKEDMINHPRTTRWAASR